MAQPNQNQHSENRDPKKANPMPSRHDRGTKKDVAGDEAKGDQQMEQPGQRKDKETGNKSPSRPGERPASNYSKGRDSQEEE